MFESALIKVLADEPNQITAEFNKMRDAEDLKAWGYPGFHVAQIQTISTVHIRAVFVLALVAKNKTQPKKIKRASMRKK